MTLIFFASAIAGLLRRASQVQPRMWSLCLANYLCTLVLFAHRQQPSGKLNPDDDDLT